MRVSDVFSPRAIPISQSILVEGKEARRRKVGPPDDDLRGFAAAGLTLRQIAERVGLSHEAVRQRLREPVGAH
jgi:Sigma-70, region 4